MTTSSDRILLRWVPLAALLAIAMAVGLSFGPHPFGFHGWPKAPAPPSIDRVVRVAPKAAPVAVARREPAARSNLPEPTAADRDEGVRPARNRRDARAGHSPRHRASNGNRSGPSPSPVRSPEPPNVDDGADPGVETPEDTPVAQVPDRIPRAAKAKHQVEPVTPPDRTVDMELDFGNGHGHGHGHGEGHGNGRHGRR